MDVNNTKTGTQSPEGNKFSCRSSRAYSPLTTNDAFVCLFAYIYDKCCAYSVYLIRCEHLKGMVKDEMVQQRWKDHQNSRDFGSVT